MLSTVLNHRSGFSVFPVCHPLVQPIFRMPSLLLFPSPPPSLIALPVRRVPLSIRLCVRSGGAAGLPRCAVCAHSRCGGDVGERSGVRGAGEGGRSSQQGETCADVRAHVPHQSLFCWVPVRETPCRILTSLVISLGSGVYL